MQRVTHKDVERACERYNKALKLTFRGVPRAGYLRWQDVRGDGSNRRGLYVNTSDGHASGVTSSDIRRAGDTMRQTVQAINLAIKFHRLASYCVIIQAIHERGATQRAALRELYRRGLWLSAEQRAQAGIAPHVNANRAEYRA